MAAAPAGAAGHALPQPYPALLKAELKLRPGQVSLWCAASGVGKSMLMGNMVHRMGVPALFWSADTDRNDSTVRAISLWSGYTVAQVEQYRQEETWRVHFQAILNRHTRHVEYCFDPQITGEAMSRRVEAFAEKRGEYPHIVVLDNASNAVQHMADEFSEQKQMLVAMQKMARLTNAHVAILHHVRGAYEGGLKPIPKDGVLNNLLKVPEQAVTMYRIGTDALGLNIVKNRSGRDDPGAEHAIVLRTDFSRALVMGAA